MTVYDNDANNDYVNDSIFLFPLSISDTHSHYLTFTRYVSVVISFQCLFLLSFFSRFNKFLCCHCSIIAVRKKKLIKKLKRYVRRSEQLYIYDLKVNISTYSNNRIVSLVFVFVFHFCVTFVSIFHFEFDDGLGRAIFC